MTGTTAGGIVIDRDFAASPQAVFDAWTKPEHFARWFGGSNVHVPLESLEFEAQAGRAWTAQMVLPDGNTIDWAGEFLTVEPNERLVFTITDRPQEAARAQIVVELTASSNGTHLHFTQETPGFTPEQQAGLVAGWQGFLDELEQIVTE